MTNFTCTTIEKKFTAAEVETVTGVSGVTQRDWRRRGYLGKIEGGGRASFTLEIVIQLATIRALITAGIPISQAIDLAGFAVLPVLKNFFRWTDDVVVFAGMAIDDEQKQEILKGAVVGVSDEENWLYAVLGADQPIMGRTNDLRTLDGAMRNNSCAVIIDLAAIAHGIAQKAALPLITLQIEDSN